MEYLTRLLKSFRSHSPNAPPVTMKVTNGTATFTVPSSLSTNFPSGKYTTSLKLPQVLTFGFGYYPDKKLTIAFDLNVIGWKTYDTLSFDFENNTTTLADIHTARMYENTFAFRLGAQYKLNEKLCLRVGTNYERTPIENGYVTPEIPDADRLNFTGGLSYKVTDKFLVEASYSFVNLKKRKSTNLETQLSGTYKTYINIPGLSLIYNF